MNVGLSVLVLIQIIFFLIIIVGVFFLVKKLGISNTWLYQKRTKWVLGSYGVLLILAIPFFYLLPESNATGEHIVTEGELQQIEETVERFEEKVEEGTIDDQVGVHQNESWEFEYDGDTLHMSAGTQGTRPNIMVVEKEEQDGVIEVGHYVAGIIVYNHVDASQHVPSPQVWLTEGELMIGPSTRQDVDYKMIRPELFIGQFTEGGWSDQFRWSSSHVKNAIVVRVPANVEVES